MKKKSVCNKFIFLSIACLFAIFAFSCVNKVESDNLVGISGYVFPDAKALSGKITSHIYGPSGNSFGTVETCFLEGWEDIPFLRFEDVCFIIGSLSDRGYAASHEGSVFKYKYGPGSYPAGWENDELCFDVANQTIYSDEFMRIITADGNINNGFAQWPCPKIPTASTACPKIEESASTTQIVAKQRTTIDLKKYDLKMFEIDGELYVPFQALVTIFFTTINFSFSGTDYYLSLDTGDSRYVTGRAYQAGRKNSPVRSQLMAEFNYRCLCMSFDLTYPLKDERTQVGKDNIVSFNDAIFNAGLGFDLLSTDTAVYDRALAAFLVNYIDDGHTKYSEPSLNQPYSKVEYYQNLAKNELTGPRRSTLGVIKERMEELRKENERGPGVWFVDSDDQSMAIITFDGFINNVPSGTTAAELSQTNTYAFFTKAFEDIEDHKTSTGKPLNLNNVVFDLSCNGGGQIIMCVSVLSFLKDSSQLYIPIKNHCDNSITKYFANITDENGNQLEKSGYNFYVLTSDFSFSCGNLFPSVCKYQNLAKVVGIRSGGGAGAVKSTQTADGALFQTSSCLELCALDGSGNFISVDSGVPVDLEIPREKFYSNKYGDLYAILKEAYPANF